MRALEAAGGRNSLQRERQRVKRNFFIEKGLKVPAERALRKGPEYVLFQEAMKRFAIAYGRTVRYLEIWLIQRDLYARGLIDEAPLTEEEIFRLRGRALAPWAPVVE